MKYIIRILTGFALFSVVFLSLQCHLKSVKKKLISPSAQANTITMPVYGSGQGFGAENIPSFPSSHRSHT
jgi:hypothetical protein